MKKLIPILLLCFFAFGVTVTASANDCKIFIQGPDITYTAEVVKRMIPEGKSCQILTSLNSVSGKVYITPYGKEKEAIINLFSDSEDFIHINSKSAGLHPYI